MTIAYQLISALAVATVLASGRAGAPGDLDPSELFDCDYAVREIQDAVMKQLNDALHDDPASVAAKGRHDPHRLHLYEHVATHGCRKRDSGIGGVGSLAAAQTGLPTGPEDLAARMPVRFAIGAVGLFLAGLTLGALVMRLWSRRSQKLGTRDAQAAWASEPEEPEEPQPEAPLMVAASC